MTKIRLIALIFAITGNLLHAQPNGSNGNSGQDIESFKKCRLLAVKGMKKHKDRKKFGSEISKCKKSFPAHVAWAKCRKQALSQNKSDLKAAKKAIKACSQKSLPIDSLSSKIRDLVQFRKNEVRFGGFNLSLLKGLTAKQIEKLQPSLDCTAIKEVIGGKRNPEYLLFGNMLRAFVDLKNEKPRETLKKLLKNAKKNQKYQDIKNLGRLYRDEENPSLFFPASFCIHDKKLPKGLDSLKIYFLVNRKKKTALPFFGIVFLETKRSVNQLSGELKNVFGGDFREFSTQREAKYLVEDEIRSFDSEDDPFNVCLRPRKHKIISVIKARKNSGPDSRLLAVANVLNLCHFGDKILKEHFKR